MDGKRGFAAFNKKQETRNNNANAKNGGNANAQKQNPKRETKNGGT